MDITGVKRRRGEPSEPPPKAEITAKVNALAENHSLVRVESRDAPDTYALHSKLEQLLQRNREEKRRMPSSVNRDGLLCTQTIFDSTGTA